MNKKLLFAAIFAILVSTVTSAQTELDLSDANLQEYMDEYTIYALNQMGQLTGKKFNAIDNENLKARKINMQKVINDFRMKLQPGDKLCADFMCEGMGMLLEKKGSLARVQIEREICTLKESRGHCLRKENQTVEKWVKTEELYPTTCQINAACFPLKQ